MVLIRRTQVFIPKSSKLYQCPVTNGVETDRKPTRKSHRLTKSMNIFRFIIWCARSRRSKSAQHNFFLSFLMFDVNESIQNRCTTSNSTDFMTFVHSKSEIYCIKYSSRLSFHNINQIRKFQKCIKYSEINSNCRLMICSK